MFHAVTAGLFSIRRLITHFTSQWVFYVTSQFSPAPKDLQSHCDKPNCNAINDHSILLLVYILLIHSFKHLTPYLLSFHWIKHCFHIFRQVIIALIASFFSTWTRLHVHCLWQGRILTIILMWRMSLLKWGPIFKYRWLLISRLDFLFVNLTAWDMRNYRNQKTKTWYTYSRFRKELPKTNFFCWWSISVNY